MSQPPPAGPAGGVPQGAHPPLHAVPVAPPPPLPPMAPIPVQPLTVAVAYAQRPGIITAMGVMSIIVASLTILGMGVQGLQTFITFAVASTTARAAAFRAQAETLAAPPVNDAGMQDDAERRTTLTGLLQARALPQARRGQLEALLLTGGRQMFPFRGTQVTERAISSNVSDSGRKFADDGNGADFYVIGKGEIEVYDTHAVFYPDDGAEMISASASSGDENALAATSSVPGVATPNGSAQVPVQAGSAAGPATAPAAKTPTFDRRPFAFLLIERLLSLGLAIYLLVIGILTLRQNPRGRRWHRTYAVAKIPLAVVGGWLTWRLWSTFLVNVSPSGGGATMLAPWIIGWTLLALAYPILLLIVLQARTVRDYYESVNPPAN